MIRFKNGLLERLKEEGYSTYKLRKENIIGQSTIQAIRDCAEVGNGTVNKLCQILGCQPGDVLEYVPDPDHDP